MKRQDIVALIETMMFQQFRATKWDPAIYHAVLESVSNRCGHNRYSLKRLSKDQLRNVYCVFRYRKTHQEIINHKK